MGKDKWAEVIEYLNKVNANLKSFKFTLVLNGKKKNSSSITIQYLFILALDVVLKFR